MENSMEALRGYRIGVLAGGASSEREISLKSGNAVFEALKEAGLDVELIDVQEEDLSSLVESSGIDLAFIALHGKFGEDGVVQRMLGHEIDYPQLSIERVSDRAKAYGFLGATYDGWDVLAVFKAVGEAVKRARDGGGPTLLEFNVHQIEGNLEGRLEAREDERVWCPIHRFKERLMKEGSLTRGLDEKIRDEEKVRVDEATNFALRGIDPDPLEAFRDIFAGGP